MTETPSLKRSLSLPLITFFGLGDIIGAGIYVLIGKVAGYAGMYAPVSFFMAAVIALFTGFSYAELSSRYPRSSGEAFFTQEAMNRRLFSSAVGWAVVLTGVVSAATIANGFVGYLHLFVSIPDWLAIMMLVLVLGSLAAWGIIESVIAAALITLVELGGLLLVLWVAGGSLAELPERLPELVPPVSGTVWIGIATGSVLAFFAFIGFEDMVNVAEEVKNPSRNMPIAILLAIGISTVLYLLISLVAVLSLPLEELAGSRAPLAAIVQKSGGYQPTLIGLISIFAIVNGALIQIIMASRVIYGMVEQGGAPAIFAVINPKTRTPLRSTALVTVIVLTLALWLPLETLARTTSFVILIIFTIVNLSLFIIKRRIPRQAGAACYPVWVPVVGVVLCGSLVIFQTIILLS